MFNSDFQSDWDKLFCSLTHLPQCPIYASVNQVSIISDNDLSPIRRQAIIYTNAKLLSIRLQRIFNKNTKFFIHENTYQNIVCKMTAIVSRGVGWGWGVGGGGWGGLGGVGGEGVR